MQLTENDSASDVDEAEDSEDYQTSFTEPWQSEHVSDHPTRKRRKTSPSIESKTMNEDLSKPETRAQVKLESDQSSMKLPRSIFMDLSSDRSYYSLGCDNIQGDIEEANEYSGEEDRGQYNDSNMDMEDKYELVAPDGWDDDRSPMSDSIFDIHSQHLLRH